MEDWVSTLEVALGLDVEFDQSAVLELARDAAHGVARPAAPLTTFLVGLAAGRAGASAEDIERAVGTASQLARTWPRESLE